MCALSCTAFTCDQLPRAAHVGPGDLLPAALAGDCLTRGFAPPASVCVVPDSPPGQGLGQSASPDPLVRSPRGFELIWQDTPTPEERRLTFWKPIPYPGCGLLACTASFASLPGKRGHRRALMEGLCDVHVMMAAALCSAMLRYYAHCPSCRYVAMGFLATNGAAAPSRQAVKCLRADAVIATRPHRVPVWVVKLEDKTFSPFSAWNLGAPPDLRGPLHYPSSPECPWSAPWRALRTCTCR